MKIGVFLDRDGTINVDKGYIGRPEDVELYPRSAKAIRRLNQLGLKVVVVSNQSGVARGFFTAQQVREVDQRLQDLLAVAGAHLDAVYFCPHHPEFGHGGKCPCRKPNAGLAEQAAAYFQIDLGRSYVIGDKISDIQLGENIGAKSILVLTGYGKESLKAMQRRGEPTKPDHVVSDLYKAVRWVEGDRA